MPKDITYTTKQNDFELVNKQNDVCRVIFCITQYNTTYGLYCQNVCRLHYAFKHSHDLNNTRKTKLVFLWFETDLAFNVYQCLLE